MWLYRGETDKYIKLLDEYRCAIGGEGSFEQRRAAAEQELSALREEAKAAVEAADKRSKKKVQAEYDERTAEKEALLTVAKEAVWLYEKFGEGVYADIPGLCRAADISEIEEKSWSLTPGAYVGVAPAEDDGVDFAQRMKEIHAELLTLQQQSNDLMDTISKNLEEMVL